MDKLKYITISFIVIYTIAAILVSVNRYWQYQTYYFDFGIFDVALWKVSRFQPPLVDHVDFGDKEILILGDHFSPSIFLLAPLYWLTDRREIILIAQAAVVALASFIVLHLASKSVKNKLIPLALVVAFLGYVGTQNALISDFHQDTVAVLPLMLIFWAIFKRSWKLYFLFLFILLGFKESFAGIGMALGLFLLIRNRADFKIGLATIIVSIFWAVLVVKYAIPYFSGTYLYTPKELPTTINEIISRFVTPLRLKAIFYTFLTFGFLPIFDLSILPGVFDNYFERFVISDRGSDLGMHYNATLAPFMFMGALYTFILLERKFNQKIVSVLALAIILIVLILHRFIIHGPLGLAYNKVFYEQNQRVRYVDEFVANFPKNGLIMTQNDLAVRLTHQNVKLLRKEYKLINPDYVILNLTPGQNPNSFFPLTYQKTQELKEELSLNNSYILKKYADELYLFSKK
ncbi:MAG: DUF2079 domain-containing protein [Patescibacteria group bacterium]